MHVWLFITTRPPEPTIAPTPCSESKSIDNSRCSWVRHPPEGPPICTALKGSLIGRPRSSITPPPMSMTICRKRRPERAPRSDPVLATCPGQGESLGARRVRSAQLAEPSAAPSRSTSGTVASVSTLLITCRLAPQPALRRETAAWAAACRACLRPRPSAPVSSPQTKAPAPSITLDAEAVARPEDVVAQQAKLRGVANRSL